MSFWDKVGKFLNPRNQVAALVDSIMDRLNEKYQIKLHADVTIEIVDLKPEATVPLPGDEEEKV